MWIYENENNLLYFISNNYVYKPNVAIFSLCNTLIHDTLSKEKSKYIQLQENVLSTLQHINENCSLVIIESGLKLSKETIKTTVKYFFELLNKTCTIPFIVLFPLKANKYQKPYTHIFTKLQHLYSANDASINTSASIVVGNAAGRFATSTQTRDVSDCDRAFASNIDICFKTPNQFFGIDNISRQWNWHNNVITDILQQNTSEPAFEEIFTTQPNVIFICGPPTSGKTLLSHRIKAYVNNNFTIYDINNYTSVAQMQAAITTNNCIIVDTCETTAQRNAYFTLFDNSKIYYIEIQTQRSVCEFLNIFRLQISKNLYTTHTKYTYTTYYNNYQSFVPMQNVMHIAYPLVIRPRKEIFFHF